MKEPLDHKYMAGVMLDIGSEILLSNQCSIQLKVIVRTIVHNIHLTYWMDPNRNVEFNKNNSIDYLLICM